ncbi:hypothetical protein [Paenibacillus sp. Z6-24]
MAILRGAENSDAYIEYTVIDHRIDELEGSSLEFKFIKNDRVSYHSKFGWTNYTLRLFIEMLQHFPIEKYEGYFSHFEKHLEVTWQLSDLPSCYTLQFKDVDNVVTLITTSKDIISFGIELEKEWKNSPIIK